MKRTTMTARFDVTTLTVEQRGRLALQVAVQAETNDDPEFYYPGVPDPEIEWDTTDAEREVLVHLNVTVPAGDDRDAGQIANAVLAAIEVGSDDPCVAHLGPIVCPLAEDLG